MSDFSDIDDETWEMVESCDVEEGETPQGKETPQPEHREVQPEQQPEHREVQPEQQPEHREVQPEHREVQPEHREVQPEHREVQPEHREVQPEDREVQPEHREVQPEPEHREVQPEPEHREVQPEPEHREVLTEGSISTSTSLQAASSQESTPGACQTESEAPKALLPQPSPSWVVEEGEQSDDEISISSSASSAFASSSTSSDSIDVLEEWSEFVEGSEDQVSLFLQSLPAGGALPRSRLNLTLSRLGNVHSQSRSGDERQDRMSGATDALVEVLSELSRDLADTEGEANAEHPGAAPEVAEASETGTAPRADNATEGTDFNPRPEDPWNVQVGFDPAPIEWNASPECLRSVKRFIKTFLLLGVVLFVINEMNVTSQQLRDDEIMKAIKNLTQKNAELEAVVRRLEMKEAFLSRPGRSGCEMPANPDGTSKVAEDVWWPAKEQPMGNGLFGSLASMWWNHFGLVRPWKSPFFAWDPAQRPATEKAKRMYKVNSMELAQDVVEHSERLGVLDSMGSPLRKSMNDYSSAAYQFFTNTLDNITNLYADFVKDKPGLPQIDNLKLYLNDVTKELRQHFLYVKSTFVKTLSQKHATDLFSAEEPEKNPENGEPTLKEQSSNAPPEDRPPESGETWGTAPQLGTVQEGISTEASETCQKEGKELPEDLSVGDEQNGEEEMRLHAKSKHQKSDAVNRKENKQSRRSGLKYVKKLKRLGKRGCKEMKPKEVKKAIKRLKTLLIHGDQPRDELQTEVDCQIQWWGGGRHPGVHHVPAHCRNRLAKWQRKLQGQALICATGKTQRQKHWKQRYRRNLESLKLTEDGDSSPHRKEKGHKSRCGKGKPGKPPHRGKSPGTHSDTSGKPRASERREKEIERERKGRSTSGRKPEADVDRSGRWYEQLMGHRQREHKKSVEAEENWYNLRVRERRKKREEAQQADWFFARSCHRKWRRQSRVSLTRLWDLLYCSTFLFSL